MACGICGGVGHNCRTCSAGSSGGGFSSSSASNTPSLSTGNGSSQSIPKGTVTCGMCGQQSHNSRTCTSGSTSQNNSSSAPRRTVTCGVCGQEGHNRRTCTSGSSSQNESSTSPRGTDLDCRTCTSISFSKISDTYHTDDKPCSNSGYGSIPSLIRSVSSPGRMATCGAFGPQGHNRQNFPSSSSTQNCMNSSNNFGSGSISSILLLSNSSSATRNPVICGTCGQQGHNVSSCTDFPFRICSRSYSEKPTLDPNLNLSTCLICGDNNHTCTHSNGLNDIFKKAAETNDRISDAEEVSEPEKVDIKYDRKPEVNGALKPTFPLGTMHLNKAAQKRLDRGPTKSDGEGYIYLYKDVNSTSGDSNLFKIGMTKNLPHLRMRQQEYANGADYFLLFSKRTKWRYLTEAVVHAQLKSCRDPKSEGDGKTEWFRGQQVELIEIIEKCQKTVDAKYASGDN